MEMNKKNELLIRVYLVLFFFVILSLVIMWRAFRVSVLEGKEWRDKGGDYVKWMPIESERGSIYSHDGSLLATSVQFFEIRIDPAAASDRDFKSDIDSLSIYLETYADFNRSRYQWKAYLTQKRDGYFLRGEKGSRNILLAKKADHDLYRKFRKFPLLRRGSNGGGLIINRLSRRTKPFKKLASRTIGLDRAGNEELQKIGIEGYYDDVLRGEESKQLMKKISGVWVPAQDLADSEMKRGDDVVSTIDMPVQDVVHHELSKAAKKYRASSACAVLMEVKTGKIRAISNIKKINGAYEERYNYAVGKLGEPGSTFKLASVLALLESGKVVLQQEVDLEGGRKKFHDQWMEDSHIHGRRKETLEEAFVISSNVGIASMTDKYFGSKSKAKEFIAYLESFGLKEKTGIEIIGEPKPYIKDPESNSTEWYGTTIPWMAHGYELMLTPLQVLNFYNAVANDGKLMKPMMVDEIIRDGKLVTKFEPETLNHQIASQHNIDQVKQMMEKVVLYGTAKNIKSDKYNLAGKTGTASVNYNSVDEKNKKHNASFAGYFPAENPLYSMIIVLYEPKGEYYGSAVAAPVFKSIADQCYAIKPELNDPINGGESIAGESITKKEAGYSNDFETVLAYVDVDFQMRTDRPWVSLLPGNSRIALEENKMTPEVVPDVTGMGIRDAVYVLENLGMSVELSGVGKVRKQSVLPGTKLIDQRIELFLK